MSETVTGDGLQPDSLGSMQQLFDRIREFDAISILIISVVSYATLYRFQAGYLRFFNVPTQYIGFSLSAIVIAASIVVPCVILLVIAAFILYWLLLCWLPNWSKFSSRWGKRTGNHVALMKDYKELLFILYPTVVAIIFLAFQSLTLSFMVGIVLIIVCLWLFWRLRIQSRYASSSEKKPSDFYIAIKQKTLAYWFVVTLLMLITFMMVADLGGHIYAWRKHEYQVAETTPEMMIVVYGTAEHAVLSRFDRNCRTIDSQYTILMTEDFYDTLFHPEELGRMKVEPIPNIGPASTTCAPVTTSPTPP